MTKIKQKVMIKGTKEGLVFHMDDTCSFDSLLQELREKVENSHQRILTGPTVGITVKLGMRYVSEEQEQQIRDILRMRGNLVVKAIESDVITKEEALRDKLASQVRIYTRTVRSGQVIRHEGDLLLIGDVNPGALVMCTGNIFVLGSLRGTAHAGCNGNKESVIAAFEMFPAQIRIAGIVNRNSDGREPEELTWMEFAYVAEERLVIEKMNQLHKIRPELGRFVI
ncbi:MULTISPECIES: septum site-determining protein MinC [Aneurinibacillus]|uniref:Probable septum site-determining protein MinC n=1 Tax=Aneurinibacillus thermoaerophilus TaxID=143495 RepID=A0A1G7ZRE9_ANETH|nr:MULTISPECIES: septum site-determining protein MinC [Aneurinibacillus]AMA72125.1 septum site-determining protein MinC [Aneurinibacillus sp. XH2]MED0676410.1 septum site-determining protein MinC [Aneurinibacillus thermoaerophilus]MED0678922.1 septum site-determining protein MinC [Aneurinibacillus thermoaerophilus]MED0736459.1 septum site-determining protein MinC [Aneurinibacillus thermoaerophilus]MED0755962.1 septum site-determining protein MinC [Aneurinibacillus thermoaerophilus]